MFVCPSIHLSVHDLRHERVNLRPERTDLRPDRVDFRPDRADEALEG